MQWCIYFSNWRSSIQNYIYCICAIQRIKHPSHYLSGGRSHFLRVSKFLEWTSITFILSKIHLRATGMVHWIRALATKMTLELHTWNQHGGRRELTPSSCTVIHEYLMNTPIHNACMHAFGCVHVYIHTYACVFGGQSTLAVIPFIRYKFSG